PAVIDTAVAESDSTGQTSRLIAAREAPADRSANGNSTSQTPAGPIVSPIEARIHYALDEWTRLEFTGGVPLRDAIRFLADAHEISILVEEQQIEDEGISVEDPVDVFLTGISLRSALNILLEDRGLTY